MAMRSLMMLLALAATLTASAATADAGKVTLYVGAHPLAEGVFCVIEAPHQHAVAPFKPVLFRVHDGHHHFIGDPVAHGYEGPKHAYVGHHPVHMSARLGVWHRDPEHDEEYCYIGGPHFHAHAPPGHVKFKVKGDAYWYVGDFGPRYKRGKRRYAKPVAAVYADVEYVRPVITVSPPVGFVGVYVGPDGVETAGGITAGVEVVVPRPVIEVDLGFGIGVGHHHHKHRKHRKHRKHKRYKRGKRGKRHYRKRSRSKNWGYVRKRRRR